MEKTSAFLYILGEWMKNNKPLIRILILFNLHYGPLVIKNMFL